MTLHIRYGTNIEMSAINSIKGKFTVDEVEHRGAPDVVTIRARSADFRGTLNSRREGSWHDTTLGAIVEAIASRNKLEASVAPSLAGIKIPHIDQSQESDAKFLSDHFPVFVEALLK